MPSEKTCLMSVLSRVNSLRWTPLETAPSVRLGEREGPTLGVRFTVVSVKRESTVPSPMRTWDPVS